MRSPTSFTISTAWATTRRTSRSTASFARSRSPRRGMGTRFSHARVITLCRAVTDGMTHAESSGTRKKPSLQAGLFANLGLLPRGANKEQHEREQHQRLDERQSDEQRQLDAGARSRIPGKSFSNRSCHLAL